MRSINKKRIFTIIYCLLCVVAWVGVFYVFSIQEPDEHWGNSMDWIIHLLISAPLFAAQVAIYFSMAYLLFARKKKWWGIVLSALPLACIAVCVAAVITTGILLSSGTHLEIP